MSVKHHCVFSIILSSIRFPPSYLYKRFHVYILMKKKKKKTINTWILFIFVLLNVHLMFSIAKKKPKTKPQCI